jgi:hypothetical protein
MNTMIQTDRRIRNGRAASTRSTWPADRCEELLAKGSGIVC